MQIVEVLVTTLLAAGGLVNASLSLPRQAHTVPSTAMSKGRQSVPARRNPYYVPHGPYSRAKAYLKFGKTLPANLVTAFMPAKRRSIGSVQTTPTDYDREYLTPVFIGSPPQQLNLDFDTGSSDLWVFSSDTLTEEVKGQTTYNASQSSTSAKIPGATWNITYGDRSSSNGIAYTDNVTIGGLTVSSQTVEAAWNVSESFTWDSNSDGLLGLAFSSLNTVRPVAQKTFFDNAIPNLDAPLFTVDLQHNATGTYNFGFIDNTLFTGPIAYTAVDNSSGFWGITASSFSVGPTVNHTAIPGIVDTGTTLLLLPDSIVAAYYKHVSGANDTGGYIFPCNTTLPDFSLGVGNSSITVPGHFINYAPVDSAGTSMCYGGIQSNSPIGFSIFGDIVLKAAFVVFDGGSNRVGFASKVVSNCTTSGSSLRKGRRW